MKPDSRFVGQPKEFWANVRTLSEAIGYTKTLPGHTVPPPYLVALKAKRKRVSEIRVPTLEDMVIAFAKLGLRYDHVVRGESPTAIGKLLLAYFQFRYESLHAIEPKLMDAPEAKILFHAQRKKFRKVSCPLPDNKQKGSKRAPAYLSCLANLMIAAHTQEFPCNFDPQRLTKITHDGIPFRTLARRLDGAFPFTTDPIAVWEVKEYYYTTTFGSRIADGVYETLLDGLEIEEANSKGGDLKHYLFVDSKYTWWDCGKPYLCRLVDMLHMGLIDEVLFGREVVEELPRIVSSWVETAESQGVQNQLQSAKVPTVRRGSKRRSP